VLSGDRERNSRLRACSRRLVDTAPIEELDHASARMEHFIKEASRIVLRGFELRTESNATCSPNHFASDKGKLFWTVDQELLKEFP
jgi:hypothetical protein